MASLLLNLSTNPTVPNPITTKSTTSANLSTASKPSTSTKPAISAPTPTRTAMPANST